MSLELYTVLQTLYKQSCLANRHHLRYNYKPEKRVTSIAPSTSDAQRNKHFPRRKPHIITEQTPQKKTKQNKTTTKTVPAVG